MSSQQPESPSNPLREVFRNRGFLVCLLLLIAMACGFNGIAWKTGRRPGPKLPAPIRKPLSQLEVAKLAPYELLQADDMKQEMLENLGTQEYLKWTLKDPGAPHNDPTSRVQLFVTYYTDNPGQVVHVPDECFVGGGFTQATEEVAQVFIPDLQQTVAFKLQKYEKRRDGERDSIFVMYLFHVNGVFVADARTVTTIMNDPWSVHGYFSKIEVSFGGGVSSEQALEAGKRLLQRILPVLVKDHFPDWQELEHKSVPQAPKAPSQATSLERGK